MSDDVADPQVLVSAIDGSINHVYPDGSEFRRVMRKDHDTIYLSSHRGCGLGCKMCWLTALGATNMKPLSFGELVVRADHLTALPEERDQRDSRLNFAFMARGDALMNPSVNGRMVHRLLEMADCVAAPHAKVTISSIFPRKAVGLKVDEFLFERFGVFQPTLYWSVYSLRDTVRREWLPEAQDPDVIAAGLKRWQQTTFQEVVLHHALISNVNSNVNHAHEIVELVQQHELNVRVNLVRYNPPPNTKHLEALDTTYDEHRRIYARAFGESRVKVQPRVGFDVKASCGMFQIGDQP